MIMPMSSRLEFIEINNALLGAEKPDVRCGCLVCRIVHELCAGFPGTARGRFFTDALQTVAIFAGAADFFSRHGIATCCRNHGAAIRLPVMSRPYSLKVLPLS